MEEPVLGRYRLERRLGSGGMAEVWLATDTETGDRVAVKRLHPHLASDPSMLERFHREAAATAAVQHPNTIRVLDASSSEVVLEYVPGETLADRLRVGALPSAIVRSLAADLAGALAAVHAAGIVHRDVTPANIILDPADRAHLGDFGIARPLDAMGGPTATGDLVGTWLYVAPEVLAGQPASPASDVWALGATLYEALTGRPPYPASSPIELVEARRQPPPPLDAVGWAPVILRMLQPAPEARPTAGAVAIAAAAGVGGGPNAITEVISIATAPQAGFTRPVTDHLSVALPPPMPGMAVWTPDPPSVRGAPARTPPTPAPRRRRRRTGRQIVLAAASALVAAGVALAAAAPAEPPAAAGVMPIGPFPIAPGALSSSAPTPTPSPRPTTTAAPATAHAAAARQTAPKPARHPKRHGKRGPRPKDGHHPGSKGRAEQGGGHDRGSGHHGARQGGGDHGGKGHGASDAAGTNAASVGAPAAAG